VKSKKKFGRKKGKGGGAKKKVTAEGGEPPLSGPGPFWPSFGGVLS